MSDVDLVEAGRRAGRQALVRAADYLRDHGWVQGIRENEEGSCCVLGALHEVVADEATFNAARDLMYQHLGIRFGMLSAWNDERGRTADEVIAALRAAGGSKDRCRSCPHHPHLGPCVRRNGSTMHACGCTADTPPEAP